MLVSLIVAQDERGAIGVGNRLPWRLSSDLKRFKAITMGHAVIMGRKTWESIGKPLPGRTNIVITRRRGFRAPGAQVVSSLEEALDLARAADENEAFVIGGGDIFALALPLADRLYLTRVHTTVIDADTFFPPYDLSGWARLEQTHVPAGEQDEYATTYEVWAKIGQFA
jgi:dihydrofolate reductase